MIYSFKRFEGPLVPALVHDVKNPHKQINTDSCMKTSQNQQTLNLRLGINPQDHFSLKKKIPVLGL